MAGKLDPLIFGEESQIIKELNLDHIILLANERLQLHIDCMNAYSQIISIEDVDDMKGTVSLFISFFIDSYLILILLESLNSVGLMSEHQFMESQ